MRYLPGWPLENFPSKGGEDFLRRHTKAEGTAGPDGAEVEPQLLVLGNRYHYVGLSTDTEAALCTAK